MFTIILSPYTLHTKVLCNINKLKRSCAHHPTLKLQLQTLFFITLSLIKKLNVSSSIFMAIVSISLLYSSIHTGFISEPFQMS
ncbi:hypothetical protein QVD17_20677 [Tagetes erecta]|uniref:Uncharacterized protein n=1 Tax=Tagetes erecta TaxID=13708 RepID=A0AAD8NYF5_TARER|nr:hypothetical protein QVD17_20677 [Tagetes erecta]